MPSLSMLSVRGVAVLLTLFMTSTTIEARSCQIRNFAGEPVDFYWMDVNNWGSYIKQTKRSLASYSSAPIKTFEGHRFFVAWADEADEVMQWDPDLIPQNLQFVHRGFDQVVIAKIDEEGTLFVDDFDVHEGEVRSLVQDMQSCSDIHPDDTDAFSNCVYDVGTEKVARLEREVSFMENHNRNVRTRLEESFCGNGKFQSPAIRSLTYAASPDMHVDVLLENEDVAIYHLREYLSMEELRSINASAPGEDERQMDLVTSKGIFGFGGNKAANVAQRAERFAKESLQLDVDVSGAEPLRLFKYGDKEIHVPPCDGICESLRLNATSYLATFIAYAEVPPGGQWRYTTSDQQTIGFLPKPRDAVLFHWKTGGYQYEFLPQLVACPVVEGNNTMLIATKWLAPSGPGSDVAGIAVEF